MKHYILSASLVLLFTACGTTEEANEIIEEIIEQSTVVENDDMNDNVDKDIVIKENDETNVTQINDISEPIEEHSEQSTTVENNDTIDEIIIIEEDNDTDAKEATLVTALDLINQFRIDSGLNKLSLNDELSLSSLNHAKYLIENDISSHDEVNSNAQFYTGFAPADRAIYTGYNSRFVLENLSTGQKDVANSLDGLMGAIYHRFAFLDFNVDLIGYGIENDAYVYNMGNSYLNTLCNANSFSGYGQYYTNVCADESFRIEKSIYDDTKKILNNSNPSYVIYPYDNQKDVTPVFYQESPDPLPNHDVSGYPISVEFNENDYDMSLFTLNHFTLTNSDGRDIDLISHSGDSLNIMSQTNDSNKKFTQFQFAIFPEQRLEYNTSYDVVFSYDYNNSSNIIEWSFTTKSLENLIKFNNSDVTINSDVSYNIYFEPSSNTELINNISSSCSSTIDIDYTFYDNNTLSFHLSGNSGDYCYIDLNDGDKSFKLNIAN